MTAAISVSGVAKDFRLPQDKATTLKRAVVSRLSGHRRTIARQHALRDITFDVEEGEFFGVVGRNGSGKSTLLKILAGIYAPNSGHVIVRGRLVPFIELGVGFNGELSGRDNVYLNAALLGFARDQIDAMYEDVVQFAELGGFMDQKLKNYSSGMQVRLAFSVATRAQADILLVDEVLAVGDASFQRKCFSYFLDLKKQHKTVVFISHDMDAVRQYCDRAMLIEDSEIRLIGDPTEVAREYSLLFMGDGGGGQRLAGSSKRWGTGTV
ncbi:MAG: ABC transporter ATP-binding protein, partial [Candidatus Dormibacteraeota bacterium]|nr:ABC transporter ATP-binding protein [Candidatus Dormibacteraeota bacterium]